MRMNMSDFATFFAVARNQSFRAAGDELGLSSSAISHSIKTLEQRLSRYRPLSRCLVVAHGSSQRLTTSSSAVV